VGKNLNIQHVLCDGANSDQESEKIKIPIKNPVL
jgi:hypothetical protein